MSEPVAHSTERPQTVAEVEQRAEKLRAALDFQTGAAAASVSELREAALLIAVLANLVQGTPKP